MTVIVILVKKKDTDIQHQNNALKNQSYRLWWGAA